jgi:hypothetical protein
MEGFDEGEVLAEPRRALREIAFRLKVAVELNAVPKNWP